MKAWGISSATEGLLYAVSVAASLFGSIGIGALSDRIGRKWLLIVSSVAFGAASLGSAAASDINMLLLMRVLTGLGLGASIPCAIALATEAAPQRFKATIPVMVSACIGSGMIVSSLAAAAVMPAWGWRGLLVVGGVFPFPLALAMAPFLPESRALKAAIREAPKVTPWRELLEPRTAATTVAIILGLVATYTVTFFFGFWLPSLLNSFVHNIRTVGLTTAAIKTSSLFGALALGRLMDRFGAGKILPISFCVAAVVLALAVGKTSSFLGLALGLGVANFFLDGSFGGIIGFAALAFPTRVKGAGIGLSIGVSRLIGGTLGPMLGGVLLGQHMSVRLVSAIFALPLLVAALMVFIAGRIQPVDPIES
jgi:AAHS family 4-hydroxybenzoate transporter-like MFS transporter